LNIYLFGYTIITYLQFLTDIIIEDQVKPQAFSLPKLTIVSHEETLEDFL